MWKDDRACFAVGNTAFSASPSPLSKPVVKNTTGPCTALLKKAPSGRMSSRNLRPCSMHAAESEVEMRQPRGRPPVGEWVISKQMQHPCLAEVKKVRDFGMSLS